MALGFGFNKAKVLSSAEKFVQQGKLQNAIYEYLKVLKEDPNDLTVQNTIGDLYSRLGNSVEAISHFRKVGDAYAHQGFTVKAIAMYKKLTKLGTPSTENLLKLADLYTQQGLYNDARAQYTAVADQYLKSGDNVQAAKIFQKILELDPENAAMQRKLADLYTKLGKKEEAKNIYLSAAQGLYARGSLDQAEEALNKVLAMDPGNTDALMLAGQVAVDAGSEDRGIKYLEKIPDIDSKPQALTALMQAKIQLEQYDQAESLAEKLLSVHNDLQGIRNCGSGLLNSGKLDQALKLYERYADKFLAANSKEFLDSLHLSIGKVKDNASALESMRTLYRKAADSSYLNEVNELLAHAYVQEGQLEKARDLYKELAELEPENRLHEQNYKQVLAKLGEDSAARPLSPEEATQAFMVDEIEHSAAVVHQQYSPAVQDAILHALTDAELFASYSQAEKALEPLESVLPQAPHDVQLNQQLASLYTKLGRPADAARACAVLAQVYGQKGFRKEQRQYSEMASKYAEQAGLAEVPTVAFEIPEEAPRVAEPASEAPVAFSASSVSKFQFEPAAPPEVPPPTAQAAPATHEIDLSKEWEEVLTVDTPVGEVPGAEPLLTPAGSVEAVAPAAAEQTPAITSPSDLVEEIRFYLAQSMVGEATATLEKLSSLDPANPQLAQLHSQLAAAQAPPVSAGAMASEAGSHVSEVVFDIDSAKEPAVTSESFSIPVGPPAIEEPPSVAAQAAEMAPASEKDDVIGDLVLDLEDALGSDFAAPPAPESAKPKPAKAKPSKRPARPAMAPAMSATSAEQAVSTNGGAQEVAGFAHREAESMLSDLLDEFKEEVQESSQEAEDPETHYNLGVAFKEMGLLDEAIGELQKVCHAIDRGDPFARKMQAYTWLAQCLTEKGVPQAAVRWYEKALLLPGIDEASKQAVYYDLASAHEAAGDKKAALRNFMEVYGSNIDYRDVAERIKALRS